MPLTVAHPAAVLLLRRLPLPMSAMVIGSMVPDLPLFLRWEAGYRVTHSLVGLVTVDVLLTLAILGAWTFWVRDALVDLSPASVRDRSPIGVRLPPSAWATAPLAALVGTTSHVVWDAFTHPGRWGVREVAWLQGDLLGLPGFKWAQYLSGIVGLVAVLWVSWRLVRSRPVERTTRERVLPRLVLPVVLGASVVIAVLASAQRVDEGVHAVAFHGVLAALQAGAVGLAGASAAWVVVARRRSPSRR